MLQVIVTDSQKVSSKTSTIIKNLLYTSYTINKHVTSNELKFLASFLLSIKLLRRETRRTTRLSFSSLHGAFLLLLSFNIEKSKGISDLRILEATWIHIVSSINCIQRELISMTMLKILKEDRKNASKIINIQMGRIYVNKTYSKRAQDARRKSGV